MNFTLLLLLVPVQMGIAQDIVLKSQFTAVSNNSGVSIRTFDPVNIDGDGIPEIPMNDRRPNGEGRGSYFLNTVTYQTYAFSPMDYPQDMLSNYSCITVARSVGSAEQVLLSGFGLFQITDLEAHSIILLVEDPSYTGISVYDYDTDGLDDIVVRSGSNNYLVYGIANGNPVYPPQDLDIQVSGDDYVITWDSVPTATAYRVLWSSSIDGTSFTRIGYTTGTTFTHHSQADQPKGFYRVMSEDNGTGVVRIVGTTAKSGF